MSAMAILRQLTSAVDLKPEAVAVRNRRHQRDSELKNESIVAALGGIKRKTVLYAYMNWDFVKRLRDTVTVKLLLKGIVTREDAQIAVENGVDGLIVSNHGGRAEESLRQTIESLPEVIEGAANKVPVLVDGGIRRVVRTFSK